MMKKSWLGLADLIGDISFSDMGLRRWIPAGDRREMEIAKFLIGQFKEAMVFLKLADMCKDHNKEDEHHDEKTVAGAC